ncbi:unnamed protein product [Ectocarpus sp. 8 AP-2014]
MAISYTIGAGQIWSNTMNSGLFPVLMIITILVGFPPCACAIELWVDSLPSQVSHIHSYRPLVFIRGRSGKRVGFEIGTSYIPYVAGQGVTIYRCLAGLEVLLDMFHFPLVQCTRLQAVCVCILGVRIKRVIDHAEAKARPGSKAFYEVARKNLRLQMVALCGTGAAYSTVAAVNELWNRAKRTPLITNMVLVMIATLAFTLVVHFSRPNRVSNRASPQASFALASSGALETRQVPGGRTSTTMRTAGIAPTPTRLVTVTPYGRSRACTGGFTPSNSSTCSGGRKVVPTVGGDPA